MCVCERETDRQTVSVLRAWASACVCLLWVLSEKCHCCSESQTQTFGSPAPTSTLTQTGRERRADTVIWGYDIHPTSQAYHFLQQWQHTNNILCSHLRLSEVIKTINEVRMDLYKLSKHRSFWSLCSRIQWNQGSMSFTAGFFGYRKYMIKPTILAFIYLSGLQIPKL